jgi:hypothetical protein
LLRTFLLLLLLLGLLLHALRAAHSGCSNLLLLLLSV